MQMEGWERLDSCDPPGVAQCRQGRQRVTPVDSVVHDQTADERAHGFLWTVELGFVLTPQQRPGSIGVSARHLAATSLLR